MRALQLGVIVSWLFALGGSFAAAQEMPPDKPTEGQCRGACNAAIDKCGESCPTKGRAAVRACLEKCKAQQRACVKKCK